LPEERRSFHNKKGISSSRDIKVYGIILLSKIYGAHPSNTAKRNTAMLGEYFNTLSQ
jgi:hypothetical protein